MRMSSSYGLKGNLQYHSCFFYAAESEVFTMKLTYYQNGDYLLPDLGLTEAEQRPVGKYGRMRKNYLKKHRPVLWHSLILSEKLYPHLREIDETANRRLEHLITAMLASAPAPDRETQQMAWVQHMNALKTQAEEIIFAELIYN